MQKVEDKGWGCVWEVKTSPSAQCVPGLEPEWLCAQGLCWRLGNTSQCFRAGLWSLLASAEAPLPKAVRV